jgi:fructokinase
MSDVVEIIGLGEVLWDLFPSGKQLGGAPFNFAFHCHQLGHPSAVVSRVGRDALGDEIRAAVRHAGLSDAGVQTDDAHPTGTVTVDVDAHGLPRYTITPHVAFDHLAWDDALAPLFGAARAVCFGTLAQRTPAARTAIQRMLQAADRQRAIVVYDVNLRQHFYDRDTVHESLALCNWVKLNDEELPVLRDLLGLGGTSDEALLTDLRRRHGIQLAALTRGAHGCLVQTEAATVALPGERVTVVDTVGAGDAFTAGLLVATLEQAPLHEAVRLANRLAGRVAGSAGATPRIDRSTLSA